MSASAIYFGSAAAAALLGLALLVWAMFADRARGRKRCPKCWYDMSAALNLRCPECGREVKHEKQLLKTRRRWKVAFVTLLPFLIAGFLAVQPKVQRDGWWSIMPTTVMLLYFQFEQDDAVITAIDGRMSVEHEHPIFAGPMLVPEKAQLFEWQWRWLAARVIDLLADDDLMASHRDMYFSWASTMQEFLAEDEALRNRLTAAIVRFLSHRSPNARGAAAIYGVDVSDPAGTIERLVPLFDGPGADTDLRVRRAGVTGLQLLLHYTGSELAIDALIDALDHDEIEVKTAAAAALGSFARYNEGDWPVAEEALRKAIERTDGEIGEHREWMIAGFGAFAEQEELKPLLHKWLTSDDPHTRAGALRVLMDKNIPLDRYVGYVVAELHIDDPTPGTFSSQWLLRRCDPWLLTPFETQIAQLLQHDDDATRDAARSALSRIGKQRDSSQKIDD